MKLTVENRVTKKAQSEPRLSIEKYLGWHFSHGYDCTDIFYMDGERMSKDFLLRRLNGVGGPAYPKGGKLTWYVLKNSETGMSVALWHNKHRNCYYTFTPPEDTI